MKKGKILIVEDSAISALDIKKTIENIGYQVNRIISKGEEVVDTIKKDKPDLIVLDIKLKGRLDGIETAKEVKKYYNIPIIFLTGNSDPKTVELVKSINPYGYIVKPYDKHQLFYNIELAFNKYNYEKELEKERMSLKALFSNTLDAVFYVGKDSRIKSVNKKFTEMFGFSEKECINKKSLNELIVPKDFYDQASSIDKIIDTRKAYTIESKRINKQGKLLDVIIKVVPVSEGSKSDGVYVIYTDITKRKKNEEELMALYEEVQATEEELRTQYNTLNENEKKLQQNLEMLNSIFENSPNLVAIFDKDGKYIRVSKSIARILQLDVKEIEGKSFDEILPKEVSNEFKDTINKMQKTKKIFSKTDIIKTKEGNKKYETWFFPVKESEDGVELIGGIASEVSKEVI